LLELLLVLAVHHGRLASIVEGETGSEFLGPTLLCSPRHSGFWGRPSGSFSSGEKKRARVAFAAIVGVAER
jgi:hypothetical protein